jgi:hypothetical protein
MLRNVQVAGFRVTQTFAAFYPGRKCCFASRCNYSNVGSEHFATAVSLLWVFLDLLSWATMICARLQSLEQSRQIVLQAF